jgi:hypothetical protein
MLQRICTRKPKQTTAAAKKAKSTKTVVRRSEAPIQSERSKITAANATAANTRQSKSIANKAFGSNAQQVEQELQQ